MKVTFKSGRLGTAGKRHLSGIGQMENRNHNHLRKMNTHNPPLRIELAKLSAPYSGPDYSTLLAQIKAAHERCFRGTKEAITAAVECGLLLIQLRKIVQAREWGRTLKTIDFPRSTAWEYMQIAQRSDGKVLKDGIHFCNLLREPDFGLLPELNGGGGRLGKAELERRRRAAQLLFNFDRVAPVLEEVLRYNGRGNPLLSAPQETVEKMERAATRVLEWAREAHRGVIDVASQATRLRASRSAPQQSISAT